MKNIKFSLIAEEMYIFISVKKRLDFFGSVVFGCITNNETLCSLFLYLCDRECTPRAWMQ